MYMINRKHHINYCLSLLMTMRSNKIYCSIPHNSNWNFTMVNFIMDSNAYSKLISDYFLPFIFLLWTFSTRQHFMTQTQMHTLRRAHKISLFFPLKTHSVWLLCINHKMWTILQNFFLFLPLRCELCCFRRK